MHRLIGLLGLCLLVGCPKPEFVVRDQLAVEQSRARITKVRNAIAETRQVIAASAGKPYLPELMMRLAELTSEEARFHYMVAYEREGQDGEALHVPQVQVLKEQAIGIYQTVLTRYPGTKLADRIRFNIAQEQRELGQFDEMRTTLEDLVRMYPDSRYHTEALLVLGDYHNDKGAFKEAGDYYSQLVDAGPGPLLGLAHYKLAWVHLNLADCEAALVDFEAAMQASATLRDTHAVVQITQADGPVPAFAVPPDPVRVGTAGDYAALDVQREALVDATYCYAQVRKPELAVSWLRQRAGSREAYVAALSKMANRFALIEQPQGAARVVRALLVLAPDADERLDDARMLHRTLTRMSAYEQVGDDVALMLRAYRRRTLDIQLAPEVAEALGSEFELLTRDLVLRAHRVHTGEAKPGEEWGAKVPSRQQVIRAYGLYLDTFKGSKHTLEMVQNLAELLLDAGRPFEAGARYRQAADLLELALATPTEPQAASAQDDDTATEAAGSVEPPPSPESLSQQRVEALYNSAVAYRKALDQDGVNPYILAVARAGLRVVGGAYLQDGSPQAERARRIGFAIARSYYDEGDYVPAIDLLTAVAYQYPGSEQGDAAAHLVLDAFNTTNDISGLLATGRRFTSPDSPIATNVKAEITPLLAAAEQRRLDDLSLAASGEQPGGMDVLLAFADRYKDSDLGERALLGTFVAARASGDTQRLYSVGAQLLQRFPGSSQAAGVASTMGQAAAARYEFDLALSYLDRAASLSKDPSQAALVHLTAGRLQQQLADHAAALKSYRAALGADPNTRARALAHIGDLLEMTQGAKAVIKALDGPDASHPEVASRLGMAQLRAGLPDQAEMTLRRVLDSASASGPALARANYGMAEITLTYLEGFETYPELDAIEELVGLVDVTVQSYLSTARQPDPIYSQAALARLAYATDLGARQLANMPLPPSLSAEERALVTDALSLRVRQLEEGRDEALSECANRARSAYLLTDAAKACISGTPPASDPVHPSALGPRTAAKLDGMADIRDRLSRNPDDPGALRTLGRAWLEAGDAHAARMVLGHLAEVQTDADDLLWLGRAALQAGDLLGAAKAFGKARDAGSNKAAKELDTVYDTLGIAREEGR